MPSVQDILEKMKDNPCDVRFLDLCKVCEYYFGKPRIKGSHRFYVVPWRGEPLVNIQDAAGKAKPYQVRQVLKAVQAITSVKGREGNV